MGKRGSVQTPTPTKRERIENAIEIAGDDRLARLTEATMSRQAASTGVGSTSAPKAQAAASSSSAATASSEAPVIAPGVPVGSAVVPQEGIEEEDKLLSIGLQAIGAEPPEGSSQAI